MRLACWVFCFMPTASNCQGCCDDCCLFLCVRLLALMLLLPQEWALGCLVGT